MGTSSYWKFCIIIIIIIIIILFFCKTKLQFFFFVIWENIDAIFSSGDIANLVLIWKNMCIFLNEYLLQLSYLNLSGLSN